MNNPVRCCTTVKRNRARPATEVGGKPTQNVRMKADVSEAVDEEGVVDGVKGFCQIDRGDNSSKRALAILPLVETLGDLSGYRKKGGGTGATRSKAVLRGRARKVNERADEAFQDLGSRA